MSVPSRFGKRVLRVWRTDDSNNPDHLLVDDVPAAKRSNVVPEPTTLTLYRRISPEDLLAIESQSHVIPVALGLGDAAISQPGTPQVSGAKRSRAEAESDSDSDALPVSLRQLRPPQPSAVLSHVLEAPTSRYAVFDVRIDAQAAHEALYIQAQALTPPECEAAGRAGVQLLALDLASAEEQIVLPGELSASSDPDSEDSNAEGHPWASYPDEEAPSSAGRLHHSDPDWVSEGDEDPDLWALYSAAHGDAARLREEAELYGDPEALDSGVDAGAPEEYAAAYELAEWDPSNPELGFDSEALPAELLSDEPQSDSW
jgi:hypothetical protein